MNLHNKISLVDDLIREDSEATIKDFIEVLNEIEEIERPVLEQEIKDRIIKGKAA